MAPIPDSVSRLTDDELRAALVAQGINPGPIVASTRELYRRKLAGVTVEQRWEEVEDEEEEEEYEEYEEEYEKEEEYDEEEDYQPSASMKQTPPSGLRSRTVRRREDVRDYREEEEEEEEPARSTLGSLCSLLLTATKALVLLGTVAVAYILFTSDPGLEELDELRKDPPVPSDPEAELL